jgi:hypothetical protein
MHNARGAVCHTLRGHMARLLSLIEQSDRLVSSRDGVNGSLTVLP